MCAWGIKKSCPSTPFTKFGTDAEKDRLVLSSKDADKFHAIDLRHGFDKLVHSNNYCIRTEIAKHGFGWDKLINDVHTEIGDEIRGQLKKFGFNSIDEWIDVYPERCCLTVNKTRSRRVPDYSRGYDIPESEKVLSSDKRRLAAKKNPELKKQDDAFLKQAYDSEVKDEFEDKKWEKWQENPERVERDIKHKVKPNIKPDIKTFTKEELYEMEDETNQNSDVQL